MQQPCQGIQGNLDAEAMPGKPVTTSSMQAAEKSDIQPGQLWIAKGYSVHPLQLFDIGHSNFPFRKRTSASPVLSSYSAKFW